MTANRSTFDDSLLRRGLAELADGPDADELVHEVLRTVATMPQAGTIVRPRMSRKLTLLLAASLLLLATVAAAIATGLLPRPGPNPLSVNGPIVVLSDAGELVGIDPVTGQAADLGDFTLPPSFGVEGPVTLGPNRTPTSELTDARRALSPDGSRWARYGMSNPVGSDATGLSVWVREPGAAAGESTMVADLGLCECGTYFGLAWSPDSTQLVVVKPDQGPEPDDVGPGLYLVNADGTELRLLREGIWGRPVWLSPISDPSTPAEAGHMLRFDRPFDYVIPIDSSLEMVSQVAYAGIKRFEETDRGVLVFAVRAGVSIHDCRTGLGGGDEVVSGTATEVLASLRTIGGAGIGVEMAGTLDGRPAVIADIDPLRQQCEGPHIDVDGRLTGGGVPLNRPARLILADVDGLVVGVQIWTERPKDLEAWIPTAMEFVETIQFRPSDGSSP